jgi:hypothetical protein
MRQRHLTPVSPIAEPPAELLEFDPTEWVSLGDQGPWSTPFILWREARRQWIHQHGAEGLGGWLTLLRDEHQTLMGTFDQGDSNAAS